MRKQISIPSDQLVPNEVLAQRVASNCNER